jgi:hypothetical protein
VRCSTIAALDADHIFARDEPHGNLNTARGVLIKVVAADKLQVKSQEEDLKGV